MAEPEPAPDAEVERLFALVSARYASRLTSAELAEVKKGVEKIVETARTLRALRLDPSDEPVQSFVPFRDEA